MAIKIKKLKHEFAISAEGCSIVGHLRYPHRLNSAPKDIDKEPMLMNASYSFAQAQGGPLTKGILKTITADGARWIESTLSMKDDPDYKITINTRSFTVSPGTYVAKPGWHCPGLAIQRGKYLGPASIDPKAWFYSVQTQTPEVNRINLGGLTTIRTGYGKSTMLVSYRQEKAWYDINKEIEAQIEAQGIRVTTYTQGEIVRHNSGIPIRFSTPDGKGLLFTFSLSVSRVVTHEDRILRHSTVYVDKRNARW